MSTPMVKQYQQIKQNHKDAILFFRLGDFYEMFYEDAQLASREMEITLTSRGKDENRMPMCGIPYHAAESYISKLIDKGYKVAICEQVEDPKDAKGVVKREVVKIITPGTVIEAKMLPQKSNNYLMAVSFEKGSFGVAYVEASTGEFRVTQLDSKEQLLDEISRIDPAELLVSDMVDFSLEPRRLVSGSNSVFKDHYDHDSAAQRLKEHFKVNSLDAYGLKGFGVSLSAAAAILDYLQETHKTTLLHINRIQAYRREDYMFIDHSTRRNLELVSTIRDKAFKGSLLWVLDKTKTNMGGRLLKNWILQPLLDQKKINERLDAVEELFLSAEIRAELLQELDKIYDIERLTGKVASSSANAKDLAALKESLKHIPIFKDILKSSKAKLHKDAAGLDPLKEVVDLIQKAITDDPPFVITEGGIIRDGYHIELDELKKAAREGKDWIKQLELEERRRSGIKSLKVGYTRVFGYYIEVSNSNLNSIPQDYIRKQTLTNAERFITPELKEKESMILNADERMKKLEHEVFCEVRTKVAAFTKEMQNIASILARLDVLLSLAEAAVSNNYCRPRIAGSSDLLMSGSRHPVVEQVLGEQKFVPNNVKMDGDRSFLLITGPNMAGKSTYMRQVALTSLMAQIGSFVPADEAQLPLVDRIFTRVGAMDDIFSGQSTFMLEMTETANILHNATEKSLIILDEIGRGTATFDGMSIAAAVAEYIHKKIGAKTLFATHYHEITQLAEKHPGMHNLNVAVIEEKDHVTFLHKIVEGPADKSYGIQVAKLAGLPSEVVERAKEVYGKLEMVENDLSRSQAKKQKTRKIKQKTGQEGQIGLFA